MDEKGTEAAAATAVVIGKTAFAEADRTLAFDRPFVYGIMDVKTGMPIFVGVLEIQCLMIHKTIRNDAIG